MCFRRNNAFPRFRSGNPHIIPALFPPSKRDWIKWLACDPNQSSESLSRYFATVKHNAKEKEGLRMRPIQKKQKEREREHTHAHPWHRLSPWIQSCLKPFSQNFSITKFYAELSYVCAGCECTTNLFTCFISYSEVKESESHSVVSDSLRSHGLYSPWNSPGQHTGVGSHSLLLGIFPTQGLNPGLLHCTWIGFFTSWATREVQEYWSG